MGIDVCERVLALAVEEHSDKVELINALIESLDPMWFSDVIEEWMENVDHKRNMDRREETAKVFLHGIVYGNSFNAATLRDFVERYIEEEKLG